MMRKDEIKEESQNESRGAVGWFVAGAALGVLGMFFLDPQKGRTRRALMRDKFVKWSHRIEKFRAQKLKHIKNQFLGWDATLNQYQSHMAQGSKVFPKTKREDHFN